MGFSNIIAIAIMITTAATLNAHGITNIETSSQAAEALRPIAGDFAYLIFALGIIGTGLLGVPVLAGSAAYAIGEGVARTGRAHSTTSRRRDLLRTLAGRCTRRSRPQLHPAQSDKGTLLERRHQWRGSPANHGNFDDDDC